MGDVELNLTLRCFGCLSGAVQAQTFDGLNGQKEGKAGIMQVASNQVGCTVTGLMWFEPAQLHGQKLNAFE